jgi:hypothetical protein
MNPTEIYCIIKINKMKKIIISVALVSLVTFYLPACKKSDKKQTTIEKIQGIWQLESDIYNDHFSGQDNIDSITGDPGDIVDFRTDGKVYSNIGGFTDTSTYALSGDTKIVLDGIHLYDIITLTANSFIIHNKETTAPSDFYEETIALKK